MALRYDPDHDKDNDELSIGMIWFALVLIGIVLVLLAGSNA